MTSRKPTHMVRKTWPRQSYVFQWTRQTCFRLNETRLCLLHSKAIQRVWQVWQVWLQLFRRQSCKSKENNSKTTIINALMRDEILANQQVQEWNNFRHLYKASSPCEAQTHISMKSTMSSFVLDLRYSCGTPFLWIIDCIIKYTAWHSTDLRNPKLLWLHNASHHSFSCQGKEWKIYCCRLTLSS